MMQKSAVAVKVLQTHAVAVLLAYAACHPDRFALRQPGTLRCRRSEQRGRKPALHVDRAAAVEPAVFHHAAEGIVLPSRCVLGQDRVHVRIEVDHLWAVADPAAGVARRVDEDLVIPQLCHGGNDLFRRLAFAV